MSEDNVVPFGKAIHKLADELQAQAVEEIQELLETAQVQIDDLEETAAGLFTPSGSLHILSVFDRIGLEGYTDIDSTPFRIAVEDLLQESRNLVDEMLDVVQEYKDGVRPDGSGIDDGSDSDSDDSGPDNPRDDSGEEDDEGDGGSEQDDGEDDQPDGEDDTPKEEDDQPDGEDDAPKEHTNKGHGNNTDGVDNDNPGKGSGGPNAGKDTEAPDNTEGNIGNQGDPTPGASQAVLDQLVNPPHGGEA